MFSFRSRHPEPSLPFELTQEEFALSDRIGVVRFLAERAQANNSPADSLHLTPREWQEINPLLMALELESNLKFGLLVEGSHFFEYKSRSIQAPFCTIIEKNLRARPYSDTIQWRPLDLLLLSPPGVIDGLELADYDVISRRRQISYETRNPNSNILRAVKTGTLWNSQPDARSQVFLELASCFLSLDPDRRIDLCKSVTEITDEHSQVEQSYIYRYAQLAIEEMSHRLRRDQSDGVATVLGRCVKTLLESKTEVRSPMVAGVRKDLEALLAKLTSTHGD